MIYYRYVDRLTTYGVNVYCYEYEVIKQTPKGVWIETLVGNKRFVKTEARKRFACPTKEEALESFKARKTRQARILKAQLRNVEMALDIANNSREASIFS